MAKSFLIGSTGLWIQWGEGVMLYPWHPAQTLAWRRIFNEQSRKGGEEKRKGEKRNMEGGKREQRKEGWREGENEVSSERDLSPHPFYLCLYFSWNFKHPTWWQQTSTTQLFLQLPAEARHDIQGSQLNLQKKLTSKSVQRPRKG